MINLIKNEFIKLIKTKKFIFIVLFSIVVPFLFSFVEYKCYSPSYYVQDLSKQIENVIDSYDEDAYYKYDNYLDYLIQDYAYKDKKIYSKNYQQTLIWIYESYYVKYFIQADYANDQETYDKFKSYYDEFIDELDTLSYKEIVEKQSTILSNLSLEYSNKYLETNDSSDHEMSVIFEVVAEGKDYLLKYENLAKSDRWDNLSSVFRCYITDRIGSELGEDINVGEYKSLKYKLDYNEVVSSGERMMNNSDSVVYNQYNFLSSGGLLLAIIVSFGLCGIVASEFEKQTAKQLLVRPFSRTKIIISKIITAGLYAFLITLINQISLFIANMIFFNANSLGDLYVVYDNYFDKVIALNFIELFGISFLTIFFMTFVSSMLTVFLSVLTKNSTAACIFPCALYFVGELLLMFCNMSYKIASIASWFPFTNCELDQLYIFIGDGSYQYFMLYKALITNGMVVIGSIIGSIIFFKKIDVKNQ